MDQISNENEPTFNQLLSVVRELRDPDNGCPWDREQTHTSLMNDLIEESYEVIQAIETRNLVDLAEELGDLLLQIAHHIVIAEEKSEFSSKQVLGHILNKLVRRHPHVFSSDALSSPSEVLQQWEKIKEQERKQSQTGGTAFSGLPRAMPALIYAYKTQVRASSVGLDWETVDGPLIKIEEEREELIAAESSERQHAEMGDLLFSVVNTSRWMGIDAESALRAATHRFQRRTEILLQKAREENIDLLSTSSEERERLWRAAKILSAED